MLDLPEPIARYFAADPNADESELAGFFTADAVVCDESREHGGIAAIRAWRRETMARTPFTARPLSFEERRRAVIVTAQIEGAFPGSPVKLDHRFTLRGGRIAMLEIS